MPFQSSMVNVKYTYFGSLKSKAAGGLKIIGDKGFRTNQ